MFDLKGLRLDVQHRGISIKSYSVKANHTSWSLPVLKDVRNKNSGKLFITKSQSRYTKQYMQYIGEVSQLYAEYIVNDCAERLPHKLHEAVIELKNNDSDIYQVLITCGYVSQSYCTTLSELSREFLIDYELTHPPRETDSRRRGNKTPVQTKRERHINMLCAFGYDTDPATFTPASTRKTLKYLMHNSAAKNPQATKERRKPWSYMTRVTIFAELLRVMKWASLEEKIIFNGLAGIDPSDIPYEHSEKNCPRNKSEKVTLLHEKYPIDIIDQMISACSGSIKYKTLFMICFYTGSRLADYKDLLWSDLEFGRKVNRDQTINVWFIYKKTDRKRVAVQRNWQFTLPVLSDQIDKYQRWKLENGGFNADDRVFDFVTDNHGGWNSTVPREFKQFFREAGLNLDDINLNGNLLRASFMEWALTVKRWRIEDVASYCGSSAGTVRQFYVNNQSQNMRLTNKRLLEMEEKNKTTDVEQTLLNVFKGGA
jgi:integrase